MADVSSTLDAWSTTAGSNSPSGSTVIGSGLDDNLRQIQAVVRLLASPNSIASATTTDLSTVADTFITVSGTTTITALGTVTSGIYKWLIFSGILTLTHNGTSLILPGAANITTAAGDVGLVLSLGSGNWRCLNFIHGATGAFSKQPTIQTFTSGSGTYTTPAGCTRIEVEIVGGGAGGAGSGSAPGAAGDGGSSTFSTITAGGGTKASAATGGAAGTATGGDINLPGQAGFTAATGTTNQPGGPGGASKLGGGGFGGNFLSVTAGAAPAANTGAGGGGAGNSSVASPGGGGGAAAWAFKVIASPAATYSYAVGAAGSAGTAGSTGDNAAAGAAGLIIVREFYN